MDVTSSANLDQAWLKLKRLGLYNLGAGRKTEFRDLRDQHPEDAIARGLDQVQGLCGWPVPEDLRELFSRFGDAMFRSDVACALPKNSPLGDRILVEQVFTPLPDGKYPLQEVLGTYRGRIPDNTIPISSDPGGNLIVYSLSGPDEGSVYAWDHEYRALPKGAFDRMARDLEKRGVDVQRLSMGSIIRQWEELNADRLGRPVGYGPLYLLVSSLEEFIDRLEKYDDDD